MLIGSLFSGIGGLELGLERAGVGEVIWQVEKDEYCRKVLAKHWPKVKRFEDVREVGWRNLEHADVICGGFPCQNISYAGDGSGLSGDESGLVVEFLRIIRELRPRYVVMENVAALLTRGFDVVLGELSRIGYDAEWSVVSACSVGAPHVRRRLFVVAYANCVDGWTRVRNPDAQPLRAIQAERRFASARAGWRSRLANPSALYRDADGISDGSHRNRAIGNAVAPAVAQAIGEILLQIDKEIEACEKLSEVSLAAVEASLTE